MIFNTLYNISRSSSRIMENINQSQISILYNKLKKVEQEVQEIRRQLTTLVNDNSRKRSLLDLDDCGNSSTKHIKHDEIDNNSCFNFEDDYAVVYTDGACENNGRSGAKAGIGVWFGPDNPMNLSKPLSGKATNNRAEIYACIEALTILKNHGKYINLVPIRAQASKRRRFGKNQRNANLSMSGVTKVKLYTDSQFTINCITQWIHRWKKNNWKTSSGDPVKNKDELVVLDNVRHNFSDIKWTYVAGHKGNHGNEAADQLARQGALQYNG